MQETPAYAQSIQALFGLVPAQEAENKTRVREVRLFAPGWDALTTKALSAMVVDIKQAVLGASLCGMQDDEIAEEIAAAWPEMPPTRIRTECRGTRVVIEAIEDLENA